MGLQSKKATAFATSMVKNGQQHLESLNEHYLLTFWIANTPISNMIDIDEAGIKLEHNNQKHWKTPTILRVNNYGVYNREEKSNLLLAICSNYQYNQTWHEIWEGEGTTFAIFYCFIEQIIGKLNKDYPGRSFCFKTENLNSHHNPEILELILEAGH